MVDDYGRLRMEVGVYKSDKVIDQNPRLVVLVAEGVSEDRNVDPRSSTHSPDVHDS